MAIAEIPATAIRMAAGALATFTVLALAAWGSGKPSIAQEGSSDRRGEAPSAATAPRLVALARLSPASGLISVGVRPGMRVVELKVKEDDQVSAGTVLAILEGHDAARSQLAMAEAQKRRSEHERSSRLVAARKAAEITKKRLDEGRTLYNQFSAMLKGKERYDAEMALYEVEMQAIKTQLDLDLAQGPAGDSAGKATAPNATRAGSPEEEILKAQVDLAADNLRETEVRAPRPGRVLRILVHPSELSSGALLMMGDVSSMVAKAEVYQSDVPRIRPGDPAEVDIMGTRVSGKVTRIGSIVGKNQLLSIDPRAMRDLRVVDVTIELDRAAPANRFVDMEVDAVIRPSGSARGPENGASVESSRGPG